MKIRNPQAWIIPILITLGCFNGLVKALTGIRFFPLLIDLAIILLVGGWIASEIVNRRLRLGILDLLATGFIVLALLGMFHPNIPSLEAGLEGYRKFSFMIIGFLLGRHLMNIIETKRILIVTPIGEQIYDV